MNVRGVRTAALTAAMGLAAFVACTGDQGPAGPAGPAGDAGTNGAQGASGANGSAGATGANGATGGNGGAGATGATGGAGATGSTGASGAAGGTVVLSERAKHGLDISPVPLAIAGLTGDQIEKIGQGSYLVNAIADCTGCHSAGPAPSQFLAGGVPFPLGPAPADGGAGPVVTTRNLTPDSATGMKLTEDQFITALRTGADFLTAADGGAPTQSLIVMPWNTFRWMSTADLRAIYAYLLAIPAQTNAIPADVKPAIPPATYDATTYNDGDQSRALPPESAQGAAVPDPNNVLRGMAIIPFATTAPAAGAGLLTPPSGTSDFEAFARGSYLVNALADCTGCHTNPDRAVGGAVDTKAFLTGGQVFGTPPPLQPLLGTVRAMSANLTGVTGYFNGTTISLQQWLTEITQGVHADQPAPQPPLAFPMPWNTFRNMELDDLAAVYTYVRAVAVASRAGQLTLTDKPTQDAARYCTSPSQCRSGESCDGTLHECFGGTCNTAADCGACQTCSGTCQLPAPNSACLSGGI